MEQYALATRDDFTAIKHLVLDGLDSPHSKRMYDRSLTDFLLWYKEQGHTRLDKATVQTYRAELQGRNLAASSVNQRLSAIRKLAAEAADNGLMDPALAAGVSRVKGAKMAGTRTGNWLTQEQAQQLLNAPDTTTLKGQRDQAILAVLLGSGLRRSEAVALRFDHVQQREGRWILLDIVGKGNRVRTVPLPSWAKAALDNWAKASGLSSGLLFRSIHKGGYINGATMTDQAIADVVRCYAAQLGLELAAHDLRRTFAKLAHRGNARLEQIQLSLGHASIKTTERYLGVQQDLTDAPCDHLGLRLG